MVEPCIFQSASGYSRDWLGIREPAFFSRGSRQSLGYNKDVFVSLQRDVFLIRMERHSHGSGQRPWRRGPDDGGDRLLSVDAPLGQLRIDGAGVRLQAVFYPNRRTDVGFVLDL